ncbi:hypothetical protein [Rhodoferax sp. GW822-FHT02A01]|uniref:hypothetical protein n=1 Tax=Rhodoferax sp. GW822-FHT02A01 TaxID=3141537 RepID=UPI00315DFAC4
MDKTIFADYYAELGLQTTSEIVLARTASAERIIGEINDRKIFDLVLQYYGFPNTEMTWFRDEFAKEDAAFSLVNNEREVRVLRLID